MSVIFCRRCDFYKLFRYSLGVTPFIRKEYLGNPSLSLTQIADIMNFTSLSYFSRYCTKHLGMNPSAYRAALPSPAKGR